MRTETIEIFQFNELSDDAKEKARDWFRGASESDEFDYDDFINAAEILGIEFNKARNNSGSTAIYWSGFCSQGDGACFEGRYSYRKGATKAIREYAPKDETLHKIADELQAVQKRNFYRLSATMQHRGHYYHSGCMAVDVRDCSQSSMCFNADNEDTLTQLMRDFADWIYSQLDKENNYRMSDDSVDESIIANEYEFYSNGKRAI